MDKVDIVLVQLLLYSVVLLLFVSIISYLPLVFMFGGISLVWIIFINIGFPVLANSISDFGFGWPFFISPVFVWALLVLNSCGVLL